MTKVVDRKLIRFSIYSRLEPNQKKNNFETSFFWEIFYRL